jgi:hypothetical protein
MPGTAMSMMSPSVMQFHNHGMPRKMSQTPGVMVIAYEANYGLRYIFTDGRPLPANDPQPWSRESAFMNESNRQR